MVDRDGFAALRHGPRRRGMRRHIDVKQSSARMFNDAKEIEEPEGRGDRPAAVTCDDALGVIAEKAGPALALTALARTFDTVVQHVCTHGSRRDLQAQLEQELVGDALLAPRRVLQGHASHERLQVLGQRRSTGLRFAVPKAAEALTMPTDTRLRFHHA